MIRLKKHIGKIMLLALVAATVFFLLRNNELGAILQTITEANPFYLVAGLALMLLFVVSEGVGIRVLLATLGYQSSFLKCVKYSFLGFYYCSITPSATGGQPAQVCYMKKDGVEVGDSSLCIMTITVAYQIGMLLLCAFAFLVRRHFLMENLGTVKYFSLTGAVASIAALFIIIGSAFRVNLMKKAVSFLIRAISKTKLIKNPEQAAGAVNAQLEKYAQGAGILLKKPGALLLTLAFVLIQIASRLSVAAVVYRSLNLHGYGFLDILSLEAFLALGVEFLPLPGSVGAAEAGFIAVNKRIFGSKHLLSATLLTRGISFYAFLIISGIVSVFAHIAQTRHRSETQTQRHTVPSEANRTRARRRAPGSAPAK